MTRLELTEVISGACIVTCSAAALAGIGMHEVDIFISGFSAMCLSAIVHFSLRDARRRRNRKRLDT